jgi:hypothetical protein
MPPFAIAEQQARLLTSLPFVPGITQKRVSALVQGLAFQGAPLTFGNDMWAFVELACRTGIGLIVRFASLSTLGREIHVAHEGVGARHGIIGPAFARRICQSREALNVGLDNGVRYLATGGARLFA